MLAEDRLEQIVSLVNARGSVSASELVDCLGASESTVRRDLTRLAEEGRIVKVHGGATALKRTIVARDQTVSSRHALHADAKRVIARHAAALIGPDDFVYLDAGSTTGCMVEFITETRATYVTNSLAIASGLLARGCRVLVPGGELKPITEALVGEQTAAMLRRLHFTLGFFGANGVAADAGFTTPEVAEAHIKETAFRQTLHPYVLADASKFQVVSPVTFAAFEDADVICDSAPEPYAGFENVTVAATDAHGAHAGRAHEASR